MPEQQENQTEVFHLKAPFKPTGDQPQAIEALVQGLKAGDKGQTLLGVTGSGKTFTMANIIAQCNRPTLILEPNKTLASQICTEMRGFFPDDAVEYFVSYYDYYQPEAYIPSAPFGHGGTVGAAQCYHCGVGFLHLFLGRPYRLPQHGHQPAPRYADGAGRALPPPGQAAI